MGSRSVDWFDSQFERQIQAQEFRLNPFEERALEHLSGTVLELGCGLGNLALAAARRGHRVVAVDASRAAVERITAAAAREDLALTALNRDLGTYDPRGRYTTVLAIGIVMFFPRPRALALLRGIQERVEPGGTAIVNVLTEGTTFMDMFEPGGFTLFGRDELAECFAGWTLLSSTHESFPAPGDTRKEFATVIARKPGTMPARAAPPRAEPG
jgi:tellurite methyltransferase